MDQPTDTASESPAPPTPPSKTFLLAADEQGRSIISVHVKRTYRLMPDGSCTRADDLPLLLGNPAAEDDDDFNETDIIPFKQRTDLILMAKAWGRGARQTLCTIRTAGLDANYLISGERHVSYRGRGTWHLGSPQPFESIEMRYENAYGGLDDTVKAPEIVHIEDLMRLDPGAYPRNPAGKGYAVFENPQRLDGLTLPNIENPVDLLTADRLLTGNPAWWWRQPLPWSCNWFPKFWYPRLAHYGALPEGLPIDDRQVPEVRLGYLDPGHVARIKDSSVDVPVDGRIGDAASPALIIPSMTRVHPIELSGFSPDGPVLVRIPPEPPRVYLRHLGHTYELPTVAHRVLISMLEMGVYVVWQARWLVPDDFFDSVSSEEELEALWKQMAVIVDRERILPLDEALAGSDSPAS